MNYALFHVNKGPKNVLGNICAASIRLNCNEDCISYATYHLPLRS